MLTRGLLPPLPLPGRRASDVHMANLFNGQERTADEWKALLAEADPRFVVTRVVEPKGSALGIIEVVWDANATT